ncbi:hypothetical protein [Novosphingobium sp. PhB165]|uniref:hypothetical protein n=1 Tax=Novosphingobium sp. PhB165 TaxID=2485105 RepID=UPI00104C2181|nr:hypothetical protein [Novosphingobium sp. PhB165]
MMLEAGGSKQRGSIAIFVPQISSSNSMKSRISRLFVKRALDPILQTRKIATKGSSVATGAPLARRLRSTCFAKYGVFALVSAVIL